MRNDCGVSIPTDSETIGLSTGFTLTAVDKHSTYTVNSYAVIPKIMPNDRGLLKRASMGQCTQFQGFLTTIILHYNMND